MFWPPIDCTNLNFLDLFLLTCCFYPCFLYVLIKIVLTGSLQTNQTSCLQTNINFKFEEKLLILVSLKHLFRLQLQRNIATFYYLSLLTDVWHIAVSSAMKTKFCIDQINFRLVSCFVSICFVESLFTWYMFLNQVIT